jgi:acylphosphatase
MDRIVRHLRIEGRVQGVGYRFFMEAVAAEHGISGWVRNRRDGSVEALVQGTPDAVAAVIEAARRGPPHSRVTEVRVSESAASPGGSTDFRTLPTD